MQKAQPTIQTPRLPAPGQRVHIAEFGHVFEDGMTLTHVHDTWGSQAIVLMEDGTIKTCSGMRSAPGIGWHPGPSPTRTWVQNRRKEKGAQS